MRVIEKTSWSASSDVSVLPVIPCFVLDTTATEFWYVTATESVKVSGGSSGAVSGVKGDAESTYRTGNVNLTPANIGALALSGGTMTGVLNMGNLNITNIERVYAHYHQLTESGTVRGNIYVSGNYLYIQGYDSSGSTSTCQYRFNLTDWGIAYRPYTSGAWQSWESHIYNATASRTANTILAAPNGSAGAATFRALVPADCSWLGDFKSTTISSAVSIPNSTWTLLGEVTLAAGRWVLTGNCQFLSSSTGRRYICVKESAASPTTNDQRYYTVNCNAISGAATTLSKTAVRTASANQKFGIWVWQNSGAALNCYGYIQAIRIN